MQHGHKEVTREKIADNPPVLPASNGTTCLFLRLQVRKGIISMLLPPVYCAPACASERRHPLDPFHYPPNHLDLLVRVVELRRSKILVGPPSTAIRV